MNVRLRGISTLSLLLALAAFAAPRAVRAQEDAPPPVKMGLWQTEVTTSISGMENSPAGAHMGGGRTQVTQSCMTADTWKKDLLKMRQQQSECTMADMHMDAHGVAFSETCGDNHQYTTTVHFQATFDGDEHMHGTATAHTAGPALPQGMDMTMHMASHYLSASCGDIKPGAAKVIR